MTRPSVLLAASLFAASSLASLTAQVAGPLPPRLTGLSQLNVVPPNPPANAIKTLAMDGLGGCSNPTTCSINFPPIAGAPAYAGGSAYDSIRRALWVSNGKQLASFFDDQVSTCTPMCAAIAMPGLGANEWVTGLGYRDSTQQLYATIVTPAAGGSGPTQRVAWYSVTAACTVTQLGTCTLSIPGVIAGSTSYARIIGGCDIFEAYPYQTPAGINYTSYFVFTASVWEANFPIPAQRNRLFINRVYEVNPFGQIVSTPCQPWCLGEMYYPNTHNYVGGVEVELGAITGLGLEGVASFPTGQHRIWATGGRWLVGVTTAIGNLPPTDPPCAITYLATCQGSSLSKFVGLSVMPGHARQAGAGCATTATNNCVPVLATRGDPNIGNSSFNLTLGNAPPSTPFVMTWGSSDCSPVTYVPGVKCPFEFMPNPIVTVTNESTSFGPGACGGSWQYLGFAPSTQTLGLIGSARADFLPGTATNGYSNCVVWQWSAH